MSKNTIRFNNEFIPVDIFLCILCISGVSSLKVYSENLSFSKWNTTKIMNEENLLRGNINGTCLVFQKFRI